VRGGQGRLLTVATHILADRPSIEEKQIERRATSLFHLAPPQESVGVHGSHP